MTWERITGSGLGWGIAFVVLVFLWAGFVFGRIELQVALIGSAICAVKL